MTEKLSQTDLEAYLDEALPPEEMSRIEQHFRQQPELANQLSMIHSRRDTGVHTLGEIWRRGRLTCPTREQMGSFLLGALRGEPADYIKFHVEVVGCRYCQANLEDLRSQQQEGQEVTEGRRRRYFQSSAGYLQRK